MRKFVTTGNWAALAAATLFTTGCGSAGPNGASKPAAEKAIRDLVDHTVAAAGRKDMDAYSKYYAPNAILVLPGLSIMDRSELPKHGFKPGYAIQMVTVKVDISDSGDLGYAFGTYAQTSPDKSGVLANTVGKWMTVFRKQPNGAWGAVADTYNVDPPP